MIIPVAAVIVQVDMDCPALLEERFRVAVDVGVAHVEGEPETAVARAIEEPGFVEEAYIPRSRIIEPPQASGPSGSRWSTR